MNFCHATAVLYYPKMLGRVSAGSVEGVVRAVLLSSGPCAMCAYVTQYLNHRLIIIDGQNPSLLLTVEPFADLFWAFGILLAPT